MAKFEITAPDGARYEIEAPDNATEQDIAKVVNQHIGGEKQYEDYKGWTDYGKDLARSAAQGAALGWGDEAIAGVRSVLPERFGGVDYKTGLQEERDAVARFRQKNPGTAIATEIAGGLATPGLGAANFIGRGANLASRMVRGGVVGAGVGGVSAAGTAEGNDYATYRDAIPQGMLVGGAIGAALPAALSGAQRALRGAQSTAQQIADNEASARLYFADRLRANNTDETALMSELARGRSARQFSGGTADLPEAIADVAPVAQRTLRGVKVGGAADDIIEPTLAARQSGAIDFRKGAQIEGQLPRLQESMRLSMNVTDQELADQTAAIAGKRTKEANIAFSAARKASQPFDLSPTLQRYSMEAMALPDPTQRSVLNRAVKLFTQMGQTKGPGGALFPVNDVDRFHKAKMALDDLLGTQKIKEQGNLYRLLSSMKSDLMDEVFKFDASGTPTLNATYRKALDQYSSRSALLNAAELGTQFAKGTETITPKMWRAMPEAEKKMVRKAWLEVTGRGMGEKAAGPTSDFTGELRKANTGNDLRLLLPPQAGRSAEFPGGNREKLSEIVARETRISDTARKVLGNSSTPEKAADSIDIGRLARVTRYIRNEGGLVQAATAGLSDALERMTAIKGEKARYLAQQLLTTDAAQQDAFLRQVAAEYGQAQARQIGRALDRWVGQFESSVAGYGGRAEGQRVNEEKKRANRGYGLIGLGNASRSQQQPAPR